MLTMFIETDKHTINVNKIAYIQHESKEVVLQNDSVLELTDNEFEQLITKINNDNKMLDDLVEKVGGFAIGQLEQLEQAAKMRAAIQREMEGEPNGETQTYQAAAPTQRVRATDKRGAKPRG